MKNILLPFLQFDENKHDRVVPPSGFTAQLSLLTSGAMAFLAVFAMALSFATGRLADQWGSEISAGVYGTHFCA